MDILSEPLTEPQVRILGVLVEKHLTTPQSYPLSENALITGCNQSTNRYPVVDYDSSVVRPALIRLRERALARQMIRTGERASKHAHRLDEQLQLSSNAPLAVLTVLMLRGAQTPGELRTRSQRLHAIPDDGALDAALSELQDRGFAEPLPRQPGEKQVRWRQLLAGVDVGGEADPGHRATSVAHDPDRPRRLSIQELAETVERLQERVTTLERELGLWTGPEDEPDT